MSRFFPIPKEADAWIKKVDFKKLAHTVVSAKLPELQQRHEDGWTVYTGLGGQAYLYWLLSEKADSYEHRTALSAVAKKLIQDCLDDKRLQKSRCCTFLCGAVGIFALAAVILGKMQYADEVLKWKQFAFDTESNELLYGKSGYLAALLFVRDHADFGINKASDPKTGGFDNSDMTSDYFSADSEQLDEQGRLARLGSEKSDALRKAIQEVGLRIVLDGDRVARPDARYWKKPDHLYWTWKEKEYLGIHGTASILSILISAGIQSPQIWQTVNWLHTLRLENGNYPTHPGAFGKPSHAHSDVQAHQDKSQTLVQFCHGAAGIGMLFAQCAEVLRRDQDRNSNSNSSSKAESQKYLTWAIECAECLGREGFLKKGISLCHGSCGNAFLFLQLYHQTRQKRWLRWAQKFAFLLTQEDNRELWRQADQPFCFANGLAGAIYFYKTLGCIAARDARVLPDFPLLHVRPDPENYVAEALKRLETTTSSTSTTTAPTRKTAKTKKKHATANSKSKKISHRTKGRQHTKKK